MEQSIYRDYELWQQAPLELNPLGDAYDFRRGSLVLSFQAPRRILSSSPLNGGVRDDLTSVFNSNLQPLQRLSELRAPDYCSELELIGRELGLSAPYTGLATAAWTERASSARLSQSGLELEVVATGGIARNAVSAGEPARYRESLSAPGHFHSIGTINLLISANVSLSPGLLCKALITVTEAKSAALLELDLSSSHSYDYATGSGTDGVILITDPEGPTLSDCGTQSELGALLAQATKLAVRRSILVNTGHATPDAHSLSHLIARYQIDLLTLYRLARDGASYPLGRQLWQWLSQHDQNFCPGAMAESEDFSQRFRSIDSDSSTIIFSTLYLHLLDRHRHGLIEWGELYRESMTVLMSLLEKRYHRRLPLEELEPEKEIKISEMRELLGLILLYFMGSRPNV